MAAGVNRSAHNRLDHLTARVLLAGSALLLIALPFSSALVEIAAVLLFLAALIAGIRGSLRVPQPLLLLLGAWLGASLLSVIFSQEPGLSLKAWFQKTCEYALLCFVAAHLGRDPRRARLLLTLLAASALVIALDALYQGAMGRDVLRGRAMVHGSRLMGPFNSPNNLASYLLLVMPVQLGLVLETRRRTVRTGLLACLLLEGVVLFGCDARGAWLVLFAALALCLFVARRFLWLGLLGVLGAIGLVQRYGSELLGAVIRLDPGRQEGWSIAWAMFLDDPFTGIGWGRFMAHYAVYAPSPLAYGPSIRVDWARPQYAHNCYLQILAEGGIGSLLAFLFLIAWILARLVRDLRVSPSTDRGIAAGLLGAVAAGLLNIGFDTGLYSLPIATLLWTLLGLAAGWTYRNSDG